MGLSIEVLTALLLPVCSGAMVARAANLTWPPAFAMGPALTNDIMALATAPLGGAGAVRHRLVVAADLVPTGARAAFGFTQPARCRGAIGAGAAAMSSPAHRWSAVS
ncbi:hypothetical protein L2K20_26410 [Mycobacterium sp. MBM]|nr:hypothetical protein [Mycobacterium sp. MBM]